MGVQSMRSFDGFIAGGPEMAWRVGGAGREGIDMLYEDSELMWRIDVELTHMKECAALSAMKRM